MLNHDTGQIDWNAPDMTNPHNGYINPSNHLDQLTHVGREALADATKQLEFEHSGASELPHAKLFFACIIIFMVLVSIFTPGRS